MLTIDELKARQGWLGASDMAAVLGLNPRESAADVFLEKTGLSPSQASSSDAAEAGLVLENFVLDLAERQLGAIKRPSETERLQYPVEGTPVRASLDAQLLATGEPVEAKTSGIFGWLDSEWGEEETDNVPAPYVIQVHCQMMAAHTRKGYIAALLGGRGFKLYPITRNEDICSAIQHESILFWANVESAKKALTEGADAAAVIAEFSPANSVPSEDTLKRMARVPSKVIDLNDEQVLLVTQWQDAAKAATEADKRAKAAKAAVIAALGDAEAARAGEHGAVTYFESSRKEYTCPASTFRTLRLSKKGI